MDEGWEEDNSEDLEALFEFEKGFYHTNKFETTMCLTQYSAQKKDQFASVKRRLDFSSAIEVDGTKGKDIIVDYKLPKSIGTKEPSNKRRYETDENVPPDNENRAAREGLVFIPPHAFHQN